MTPFWKLLTSSIVVGTLTVTGVACSSSDDSDTSSEASIAAWCQKYEKFEAEENSDDTAATAKMAADLAKDAPKEISEDMNLLADVFEEMDSIDFSDQDAMDAFEAKFDEDKLDAAAERLGTFMEEQCGVDTSVTE